MRITKTLSEHRTVLLWLALTWTGIVTVLCLISLDGLPAKSVMSHDKMGHGIFHFGMTSVWFLYFRFRKEIAFTKALLAAFTFSLLYGVGIELMQYYFTDTRKADVHDVFANATGALVAVSLLFLGHLYRNAETRKSR